MRPAKTQPRHPCSLINLCCALKGKISSCRQWKLIRLGKCTHWSESSLGARHFVMLQLIMLYKQKVAQWATIAHLRANMQHFTAIYLVSELKSEHSRQKTTFSPLQVNWKALHSNLFVIYLVSEGRTTIYFEPWQKPRTRLGSRKTCLTPPHPPVP